MGGYILYSFTCWLFLFGWYLNYENLLCCVIFLVMLKWLLFVTVETFAFFVLWLVLSSCNTTMMQTIIIKCKPSLHGYLLPTSLIRIHVRYLLRLLATIPYLLHVILYSVNHIGKDYHLISNFAAMHCNQSIRYNVNTHNKKRTTILFHQLGVYSYISNVYTHKVT